MFTYLLERHLIIRINYCKKNKYLQKSYIFFRVSRALIHAFKRNDHWNLYLITFDIINLLLSYYKTWKCRRT